MPSITTQEIAARVGGELNGPGDVLITGVDRVEVAKPDQITFIRDARHAGGWSTSRAGALLLTRGVSLETLARITGNSVSTLRIYDVRTAQEAGKLFREASE